MNFYRMNFYQDANIFHYLETWQSDPTHESTTVYLIQMQTFQRHLTTEAFKIAGGIELTASNSSKPVKQNRVALEFVTKITKSFLDALYAFLDGLVHLASDETEYKRPVGMVTESTNRFEAADLSNPVSRICIVSFICSFF